jgi:guanyl-specific ribonuclease Sa
MSGFENMVAGREELADLLAEQTIPDEVRTLLVPLLAGSPVDAYAIGFEVVYNARDMLPAALHNWARKAAFHVHENGFHGKGALAELVMDPEWPSVE